jgi:4-hydroxy-3-polyprenylbenzoate decarboxylase
MNLAYDDLRDWIKTLEKQGELKHIREEVSPELGNY